MARPIYASIERKLGEVLRPVHLSITNESHLHAGHSGNPSGAPDAETHFRVEVVSDEFSGKSLVQRHRLVYSALDEEMTMEGGVHALALKTKTPSEVEKAASK
eukprot:CAMPEP_0114233356 /NCGR_PEP_ID=MMETSP0058-20121206/5117_1 /TAXON_ID=36894 /ORGANISM="Pyramimonas parkeae, CCMP726" /LENGTH=102 /DNA_ID=CAMNT_0001344933 /DNA_START=84 /DNA_END=392 /DNA_ORIENTATION=-